VGGERLRADLRLVHAALESSGFLLLAGAVVAVTTMHKKGGATYNF